MRLYKRPIAIDDQNGAPFSKLVDVHDYVKHAKDSKGVSMIMYSQDSQELLLGLTHVHGIWRNPLLQTPAEGVFGNDPAGVIM